jgi:hypothetical protein
MEKLRGFNFCHLPFVPTNKREARGLPRFMKWMSEAMVSLLFECLKLLYLNSTKLSKDSEETSTILRLEPETATDKLLFDQCERNPPLRSTLPSNIGENFKYTYCFISSHRPSDCTVKEGTTMAFWIGEGERAALGMLL